MNTIKDFKSLNTDVLATVEGGVCRPVLYGANGYGCLDTRTLDSKLSQSERVILQKAKSDLEKKNSYFPRIVADLESSLRPLAINQKLSDSVKLLYMTITSHEYKNKGLGIGLMSIGQWL